MLTYLCCYVGMLVLSLPFPALAQALQWRWLHCQMRCEAAWNPPPAPPTARQPAAQAALVSVTNGLGSAISALPSPVGRQAQPRSQAAWRGGEAATTCRARSVTFRAVLLRADISVRLALDIPVAHRGARSAPGAGTQKHDGS